MPLRMEVGLGLDWNSAHRRKKGTAPPNVWPSVYCGETSGWIRIPLGTEVNLGPAVPPKRGTPPVCGPCLLWPNGWMDKDATWYGSRPRPRPHCVRRGPSSPRERSTAATRPSFRPMSTVVTVAHLSYCWTLVLTKNIVCEINSDLFLLSTGSANQTQPFTTLVCSKYRNEWRI